MVRRTLACHSLSLSLPVIVLLAPAPLVLHGCEITPARFASPRPGTELRKPIGEPMVYELSAGESEVVDVIRAGGGSRIFVASPGSPCAGDGESSSLPVLVHDPRQREDLREVFLVDLGPGESTSVAAHPNGAFSLVAMKDPHRPNLDPGRLVVVEGEQVTGSIKIGLGPDSVAIAPDGSFAVVACEAETPDPEDCPAEKPEEDAGGSIQVVDLRGGPRALKVIAEVTAGGIFERFLAGETDRAASAAKVEPEFVAIAPDSTYALITLQEQSAVAVVDLQSLRLADPATLTRDPREAGRKALLDVVLLPHGFRDRWGLAHGSHPDGVEVSPDGSFALTANEAHPKARHLQGISVLDLRSGPRGIRVAGNYSITELDPTLGPVSKTPKRLNPNRKKTPAARSRVPRLDPEGVAIARRQGATLAALAIERSAASEPTGSVLILEMDGVLSGAPPRKLDRKLVGVNPGARPETLEFTADGSLLFVACERDGGTLTVIPIR